jgi:uncharacterized protein
MAKNDLILDKTRKFVREQMEGEGTGHDWWHIVRVVNSALHIAEKEGGDLLVIELAALLHDIADWKFNDGDTTVGARVAREWLQKVGARDAVIEEVAYIVEHVSFKGGTNMHVMKTTEGKIVQDADRLDAMGAIGISRAFAFGGAFGRTLYNPDVKPNEYDSFKTFKNTASDNHTINHFYEKLLLLKDRMNTKTGRQLAKQRHEFMENYLKQFYAEWEGSI